MPAMKQKRILPSLVFPMVMAGLLGGCTINLSTAPPVPEVSTAATNSEISPSAEALPTPTMVDSVGSASPEPADDFVEPVEPPYSGPPTDFHEREAMDPLRPEFISDFPMYVHPEAGGAIPAKARPVTAIRPEDGTAVIKTPSGNIGCDLSYEYSGCGILSMLETRAMGTDSLGDAIWWVPLPNVGDPVEEPQPMPKGDAPLFEYQDVPPQVVEYGQIVRHGDMVCASESEGLTCWNVWTGHGAFMNSEGIYTW